MGLHAVSVPSNNRLISQQNMSVSEALPMSAPYKWQAVKPHNPGTDAKSAKKIIRGDVGFGIIAWNKEMSKSINIRAPHQGLGQKEEKQECLVFLVSLMLVCASHRKLGVNCERLSEKCSSEKGLPCETA